MYFLPGGMHEGIRLVDQQAIKEENLKRIFLELLHRGEMTRVELRRITGLGASTISVLVDELVHMHLFVEIGPHKGGSVGRRPINLRINPDGRMLAVFALSRTGVQYTLFDLTVGVREQRFVAHLTDKYGGFKPDAPDANPDTGADYPAIIEAILRESALFDPARCAGVGIVFPGLYLPDKQAFSLTAMHVSFSRQEMAALEDRLQIPLFFGNSSMSHAYAEKKRLDKEGDPVADLLYINVSEGVGVGAGIVCNGEPFLGAANAAGEIGHVTINHHGKRCECGNRGCLEQYVNVDALIHRVQRALKSGRHPSTCFRSPEEVTLASIGLAYDAGDAIAVEVVDDVAEMLFRGIYSAICITGIKRVVIGGLEPLGQGFLKRLRAFATENESGERILMHGVSFDYAHLGSMGEIRGIAQYFVDKMFSITA